MMAGLLGACCRGRGRDAAESPPVKRSAPEGPTLRVSDPAGAVTAAPAAGMPRDRDARSADPPGARHTPSGAPQPQTVTVKYLGLVRTVAGISEEQLPIGEWRPEQGAADGGSPAAPQRAPMTLGRLLERLAARHGPEFAYYTRAADGSLPPHALVVVDGVGVRRGQAADLILAAGRVAEIMVVPAMCGG
jgi:hypothetical protein